MFVEYILPPLLVALFSLKKLPTTLKLAIEYIAPPLGAKFLVKLLPSIVNILVE
ncbi:hypothetical protein MBCUT_04360 [Methanobrevibacter cuticularis]|uniref:Uncharacterized protein n=1 Tax=Methanobrevibacter cuticularis TaxID=47311 RepID=A0A166EUL8_9EURY|nr:hypothetical protein MBCUT_04360 [Methanobrevibacter cuticularis]